MSASLQANVATIQHRCLNANIWMHVNSAASPERS